MLASPLRLVPLGIHEKDGWAQVDWQLAGLAGGDFTLSHAVPAQDRSLLGDPARADHAIAAILLRAMQRGQDLVVEGRVSPRLLDGLETLQQIWQRWAPGRYRVVGIEAAEECEPAAESADRPALFAFSGGVDASFSLFRHLHGEAGRHNRRPGAALLVHGMDIPLQRDDFYTSAAARAETMLQGSGVRLLRMRTNSRALEQDWEDSFGLQLGACFLVLQQAFAHALKGSEEPYEALAFPWGSTPLTDCLLSTGAMQVEHDGCSHDRTEKVAWLAAHTRVADHLRVCWAGEELDRNCGECEKCVRTMLNFWAIGEAVPAAFPVPLTPARIKAIRPGNPFQIAELKSVLRHARQHHPAGDPLIGAIRRVLRRAFITRVRQRLNAMRRQVLGGR